MKTKVLRSSTLLRSSMSLQAISQPKMTGCRLVWNRIWAVLSDFFIQVGCHKNLQVAMFAVDSLRQLAMKFLERDELANYSFQTLFMTPLVVVMRQSKAVEIRELIIRSFPQQSLLGYKFSKCMNALSRYLKHGTEGISSNACKLWAMQLNCTSSYLAGKDEIFCCSKGGGLSLMHMDKLGLKDLSI